MPLFVVQTILYLVVKRALILVCATFDTLDTPFLGHRHTLGIMLSTVHPVCLRRGCVASRWTVHSCVSLAEDMSLHTLMNIIKAINR